MNAQTRQATLFSYGLIRETCARADTPITTPRHIRHFIHPEPLDALRTALLADAALLGSTPDAQRWQQLSPLCRQCLGELHSGIMLRLLENLSGIHNLLPDTYWQLSRLTTSPRTQRPTHSTEKLPCALLLTIALDTVALDTVTMDTVARDARARNDKQHLAAGDAILMPMSGQDTTTGWQSSEGTGAARLQCVYFTAPVASTGEVSAA